jgi:hypothetical protein
MGSKCVDGLWKERGAGGNRRKGGISGKWLGDMNVKVGEKVRRRGVGEVKV